MPVTRRAAARCGASPRGIGRLLFGAGPELDCLDLAGSDWNLLLADTDPLVVGVESYVCSIYMPRSTGSEVKFSLSRTVIARTERSTRGEKPDDQVQIVERRQIRHASVASGFPRAAPRIGPVSDSRRLLPISALRVDIASIPYFVFGEIGAIHTPASPRVLPLCLAPSFLGRPASPPDRSARHPRPRMTRRAPHALPSCPTLASPASACWYPRAPDSDSGYAVHVSLYDTFWP